MVKREIYVNSFAQYIEEIMRIKKNENLEAGNDVLWFRGHRNYEWSLIPSLYRGAGRNETVDNRGYTNMNLREGIRQQQNHAKNYQFLKNDNLNQIEWMAIAQHYGVKTRLLDWTTSAIHALLFALEDKFTNDGVFKNENNLPCIWCLFPQRMNRDTVSLICEENNAVGRLIPGTEDGGMKEIMDFLDNAKNSEEYKKTFFESEEKEDEHLNYLFNLAYFEELLSIVSIRPSVAYMGGLANPLHYILDKIYGQGIGISRKPESKFSKLAPLAIIHPYHSERIRAQQGVFTIFPNLITDKDEKLSSIADMRKNTSTAKYLNRIIIQSPEKIAEELKALGAHRSWLYPEEPIVSQEIENGL